jgi:hypothetical protein
VGFLFWWQKVCENQAVRKDRRQKTKYGGRSKMADQVVEKKAARALSLDGWAVAIALLLAALVRLGVLKHVGW